MCFVGGWEGSGGGGWGGVGGASEGEKDTNEKRKRMIGGEIER